MDTVSSILLLLLVSLLFMIARLLMQCREANVTDWGSSGLNLIDGCNRLFCRGWHRMPDTVIDLPAEGPAIVVSNHISGLDPFLLIAASHRPLRFLIAEEQYYRWGMQWLFRRIGCIPVNRSGNSGKALRAAMAALDQGEVIAIFPQGGIHLPSDKPKRLKGGAARLALHAGCPLYPAVIEGVAGAGHVAPAVFLRGEARVIPADVIRDYPDDVRQLTNLIASRIQVSPH